jgi:hypothetical protein
MVGLTPAGSRGRAAHGSAPRFCIARQRDGEINISREPRLRPDGNGQAANQSEADVGSDEVGADLA